MKINKNVWVIESIYQNCRHTPYDGRLSVIFNKNKNDVIFVPNCFKTRLDAREMLKLLFRESRNLNGICRNPKFSISKFKRELYKQ